MTDPTVTFKGAYLFDDYLAAHRLNRRGLRIGLRVAVIAIGCSLVLLGVFGSGNPLYILSGVFFVVWGAYLSGLVFRLRVRRRWKQYPAIRNRSLELSLGDNGVSSTDDVRNPAVTKWESFVKWKEDGTTFSLHLSPHLWLSLPKRLLRPEDVKIARASVVI